MHTLDRGTVRRQLLYLMRADAGALEYINRRTLYHGEGSFSLGSGGGT